jgi:hypothetical protein
MPGAVERIVVQATRQEKRAIAANARRLGLPISELMRRGASAYEPAAADEALAAVADAARAAAERAGAAIGQTAAQATRREFDVRVRRLGIDPMTAIHKATLGAAQYMGAERDSGSGAEGKFADVIAVAGNSLRHMPPGPAGTHAALPETGRLEVAQSGIMSSGCAKAVAKPRSYVYRPDLPGDAQALEGAGASTIRLFMS